MSTAANPQDDFEKSLLDMGVANELLMSDFDDDGLFTQNDDQVALSAHHNQTRQQPPPSSTQQDTLLTATLTTDNSTDQRTERTSPKRSNNNSNMTGLFGFLNAGNNNNNNDQIDQMDTSPHSSTIASTVTTTSPKRVCRGQTTTTMTPPKSVASILEDAEKLIQSGGRTSSSPSAALTTTTPSPRKAASVEACGTCFSLQKLDLKDATPEAKLAAFKEFCTSDAFTSFCGTAGLHNPSFTWNDEYAVPNKPLYERFLGCLASDCTPQACLGIVFHGTATGNVPNILENGLDPKRRSGQAYGPGEYFGKTPGTSVSYCKGGHKMLVFVVLLPSIHTKRADDHPTGDTTATSLNKQRTRYNVPMDYVVVENNHHQLPIGVLEFGSVDQAVLSKSQRMRNQLLKLNQEALAKSQQAEQLKLKATIIEYMVKEQWDNAEHKWQRHESALSGLAKREISMYAHMKLGDSELVNCLFPNMPDPMTSEELESSKEIVTVEKQEKDAKEAAEKLEEATQKMMKEQEKEQQKQKLQQKQKQQQQQQQAFPSHSHYQTSPNRAHHYSPPPPRPTTLPQPLKQPINQGTPHAPQQVQPGLLTRGLYEHQQNPVWQSGTGSTQQQPFLAQQQQPFGQHQQQSPATFGQQQQQRQGAPVVFGQQPPIVRQSQPYSPPGVEPRPLSQLLVECLTAAPPTKKLTWQTDRDMPGRREMINYIVETAKAEPYQRISLDVRLPRMARAAEVMLYQNAANFDEYNNVLTMHQRLQDILQQQRRSAGITATAGETPLGQQRWGSSSTGTPSHY